MIDIELKENLWGYAKRLRFVCSSIEAAFPGKTPSELRILDVGCGSAVQLGLPLARRGFQLTGIDTHEPSIAKAREMAKDLSNANFICGNVEDLDAAPFDVVILSEVLEHVTRPEKLLKESLLHLRRNGLVIITVPNGYGEFEWDSWIYRNFGVERLVKRFKDRGSGIPEEPYDSPGTENQEDRHIQYFSQGKLLEIFRSQALDVIYKQGSSLLSGPFAAHTFGHIPAFSEWNARIADRLPLMFSSGWFFALKRSTEVTN